MVTTTDGEINDKKSVSRLIYVKNPENGVKNGSTDTSQAAAA
jgi:hypothetical protein